MACTKLEVSLRRMSCFCWMECLHVPGKEEMSIGRTPTSRQLYIQLCDYKVGFKHPKGMISRLGGAIEREWWECS